MSSPRPREGQGTLPRNAGPFSKEGFIWRRYAPRAIETYCPLQMDNIISLGSSPLHIGVPYLETGQDYPDVALASVGCMPLARRAREDGWYMTTTRACTLHGPLFRCAPGTVVAVSGWAVTDGCYCIRSAYALRSLVTVVIKDDAPQQRSICWTLRHSGGERHKPKMKRREVTDEDMVWVPSLHTVISLGRRRGQSFSLLRDMNCDLQDGLSLVCSWSPVTRDTAMITLSWKVAK
ncbi:hypothetical protein GIB67_006216 [Kingdonia uniflora]|uniref:Uncharacterized protein n=1 Tax=Kingdonia uniflora TaxID=39325 RepID=A0A7J7P614_9MAGN|nr:hypothetical protein GIB67_006216 [Kingdonia uniflora]